MRVMVVNIKNPIFVDCRDSFMVPESVSFCLLFFLDETTRK